MWHYISASGGFVPRPPPGFRPWTPLVDFRPPGPLTQLDILQLSNPRKHLVQHCGVVRRISLIIFIADETLQESYVRVRFSRYAMEMLTAAYLF